MRKRRILFAATGLTAFALVAGAMIRPHDLAAWSLLDPAGNTVECKTKGLDYGNVTNLEFFRHVCTNTGIPYSGLPRYRLTDGNVAQLSFDQDLQVGLRKLMEKTGTPYAVFVAIEPKTGRVLANVSYSTLTPSWEPLASFYAYPMASLFKVITAAAAFESGNVTAESALFFRGGSCSESPSRWGKAGRSRDAGMPLADAMAHSVNPAFGRLAADRLGPAALVATAQQFGFGSYPFGGDFIASGKIHNPATDAELMRMAAGLDHSVRTSPFHVAMLFAAIANGGVMPAPSFVDAVTDPAGQNLYSLKPSPLLKVASPAAANELIRA